MYNFIDVIESSEGVSLPSEALQINGEYIEDLIQGYRTLTVEGREALSPEVLTYETGIRDGSTLQGKRYPARIIRITYQLIAATNEDFRAAYNKLARILDVENAELIFNDEKDKFFVGTPCLIGEVEPGKNSVVGVFEILCADPFKYSVIEYEAEAALDSSSVLIDYEGTYKAFPRLVAEFPSEEEASADGETVTGLTGNGDCGYVAFFNEDEKIIQLGDPDEVDGETAYEKSQTLVSASFNKETGWGTAAKSQWAVNSGITSSSAVEQAGYVGIKVATYTQPSAPAATSARILTAESKAESPFFHYTVNAQTKIRTRTSVKIIFTVSARLDNYASYFGKGYILYCAIYIGGAWHNILMHPVNHIWRGTVEHKKTISVDVPVNESTTAIEDIRFKAWRDDDYGKSGILASTACKKFTIGAYPSPEPAEYYLCPTTFGTGDNWHGASITRTIPADASGVVGATNFKLSYSQKMCIGSGNDGTKELGAFQVLLVNGSGANRKIVAGVNIYKGAAGKRAKLRFYLNGAVKKTLDIDLSYNNQYFKLSKASTITKEGSLVTFNICGIKWAFRDANIADTAVHQITFTFTRFGSTAPALSYNGLFWAKFVKNNCDTWRDIPNKFSANDTVEADCNTGKIYLNGVEAPAYGALGNDWEHFYLTPGLNQIGFSYSDWVDSAFAPAFKVKYREVFL